jgi:hypothetical protein
MTGDMLRQFAHLSDEWARMTNSHDELLQNLSDSLFNNNVWDGSEGMYKEVIDLWTHLSVVQDNNHFRELRGLLERNELSRWEGVGALVDGQLRRLHAISSSDGDSVFLEELFAILRYLNLYTHKEPDYHEMCNIAESVVRNITNFPDPLMAGPYYLQKALRKAYSQSYYMSHEARALLSAMATQEDRSKHWPHRERIAVLEELYTELKREERQLIGAAEMFEGVERTRINQCKMLELFQIRLGCVTPVNCTDTPLKVASARLDLSHLRFILKLHLNNLL